MDQVTCTDPQVLALVSVIVMTCLKVQLTLLTDARADRVIESGSIRRKATTAPSSDDVFDASAKQDANNLL